MFLSFLHGHRDWYSAIALRCVYLRTTMSLNDCARSRCLTLICSIISEVCLYFGPGVASRLILYKDAGLMALIYKSSTSATLSIPALPGVVLLQNMERAATPNLHRSLARVSHDFIRVKGHDDTKRGMGFSFFIFTMWVNPV